MSKPIKQNSGRIHYILPRHNTTGQYLVSVIKINVSGSTFNLLVKMLAGVQVPPPDFNFLQTKNLEVNSDGSRG